MRHLSAVVASLVTAALVSACGSGSGLSTKVSAELEAQVQAVRTAAVDHDRALTAARLTQLRLQVTQLENQGQISHSKTKAILAAVADVEGQLATIASPPAPPPSTVPAPPSTTAPAQPGNDQRGKHGGHDSVNGKSDGGHHGGGG